MFGTSFKFLLLALCVGLGWGWTQFSRSASQPPESVGTGRWSPPPLPTDYSTSAGRFESTLTENGFLARPVAALAVEAVETSLPQDPLAGLEFLSAARINNKLSVQLRLPEGQVKSFRQGETVLEGWIITAATPYSVQLEKAGEQRVFGSRIAD